MIKYKMSGHTYFSYSSNAWVNTNVHSNMKITIIFLTYILNKKEIVVKDLSLFLLVSLKYAILLKVICPFIVTLFTMNRTKSLICIVFQNCFESPLALSALDQKKLKTSPRCSMYRSQSPGTLAPKKSKFFEPFFP